ncbi:hypothetical protein BDF20DRAFT_822399 [Mycotypha africana]|uniref:uncharacterized protein n=1 Tax=Mycotypha africana TaxID=64632 RepID=UPI00230156ED|nr:uncharacterized protein BDF20DRAFT_822399 [Mycotypha africana]KAI8975339.1 hypothetical protein BDF20DRAFT_822399 [Mycotypha africana]
MIAARSEYRDNNKAPRWRYCTEPIISILDKSVPNHAFFTHRKEHLNIIALGRTGDGKSTLLNDMLGKQVFHHKQSAKSQTKQVQTASGFWAPLDRFMHEKEDFGCYIHATDTPGFGDSLHRDDYFQSIIQQAMVDMALDDGIHCILLVFKISTK